MKLTFLGTSAMVPTKERNVSGQYLDCGGFGILFDCGEGTQRQMNIAGINRNKVKIICISHWHADHVGGLMGLLQTISSKEREVEVTIIGPSETKKRLKMITEATHNSNAVKLNVIEVKETNKKKIVYEENDFFIEAISLEHGIPALGYCFVEKMRLRINTKALKDDKIPDGPHLALLQKGIDSEYNQKNLSVKKYTTQIAEKRVCYLGDTAICDSAVELAQDANVLVCESTYTAEMEKQAKEYRHMTSVQAASIAKKAKVQKLFLTHISQRYKEVSQITKEAKKVFLATVVAKDFDEVKI